MPIESGKSRPTSEQLAKVPLFARLEPTALEELAALSRLLRLDRKETLFQEGRPYRGMYVVLEGLAVVYKLSQDGRMLILHVCRAGDTLAEVPLFEEQDAGHPAHARTTRESEILFLPRETFVPFLQRHPQVEWELLKSFAARLKELSLRLEGVTLREVASRLARYLLREAEATSAGSSSQPEIVLPLAKGAVASYLGTVHETLSRTFARLIRDKVVAVDGRKVTILDKQALQRLL